jgi:hypothetical protein
MSGGMRAARRLGARTSELVHPQTVEEPPARIDPHLSF